MAGKNERQRRQAREKYRRQQEQRLARQRQVRRRWAIGTLAVLVAAGVGTLLLVFLPGGGHKKAAALPSKKPSASATATATAVAEPAHHCDYTSATSAAKKESLPPATPDFAVLQCGDAYATADAKLSCSTTSKIGTGGPGYDFASENLTGAKYPAGTVAMANSGTANSNGSQFFIVFKDSTSVLNGTSGPAYTPFATVSSGLGIVQNVAKDGYSCQYPSAGGGVPKKKVLIDSVTIKKT